MKIQTIKCHGSGNDFLIIDEMEKQLPLTEKQRSNLSAALCKRSGELGADGILFIQSSNRADAKMRIFNADGSEASMCGNGLRCVGRYVSEKLGKAELLIETMKADLEVKRSVDSIFGNIPTYQVEISPVYFNSDAMPMHIGKGRLLGEKLPLLSEELKFSAVAVPNPHLISLVTAEQLQSDAQRTIAEYVNEPNELFPDGVNVSFVLMGREGEIFVRTFERGVGFTNACGTAMSASSLITCLLGYNRLEEEIHVFSDGGKVRCAVHEDAGGQYMIDLIGNATYVYSASFDFEADSPEEFTASILRQYDEQEEYGELKLQAEQFLSNALA